MLDHLTFEEVGFLQAVLGKICSISFKDLPVLLILPSLHYANDTNSTVVEWVYGNSCNYQEVLEDSIGAI